ncbi:hypothetical protein FH972_006379 [Carpinus fangiana]|uniref:Uncharacterized protein n=1 Tax=Carpinus fangiana TaxID=176857 RepID=A0A5N6QVD6_9ROSI|nr:hypothetical protein FH972_006379 [Carpinus fangiana]
MGKWGCKESMSLLRLGCKESAWLSHIFAELVAVDDSRVFWDHTTPGYPRVLAQKDFNRHGQFLVVEEYNGREKCRSFTEVLRTTVKAPEDPFVPLVEPIAKVPLWLSGRTAGKTISVMPSKSETSGHGPAIQSLSLAAEVISPKDPSLAIAASRKDFSPDSQGLVLPADKNIADNCSVTTDGLEYAG